MMTSRVIFEYTPANKYMAQGGGPTRTNGYGIWIEYSDDDALHFLGHIPTIDLGHNIEVYKSFGYRVIVKGNTDDSITHESLQKKGVE